MCWKSKCKGLVTRGNENLLPLHFCINIIFWVSRKCAYSKHKLGRGVIAQRDNTSREVDSSQGVGVSHNVLSSINLSPLLVTKNVFMLIIILGNYQ